MNYIYSYLQFSSIFLVLLLSSCESTGVATNEGSPEETMKIFIEKVMANDFEGAKKVASNRTDKTLDALIRVQAMFKEIGKENQMSFGRVDFSQKIKIKCTTEGNKATCDCCEEITGNCQSIAVLQGSGKWLIDQPKESNVE